MANRRFIAGAVCPQCRALDRILVETREDGRVQRCVSCGFERAEQVGSSVPKGRLEERGRAPEEFSPVRLVDPARDASHDD